MGGPQDADAFADDGGELGAGPLAVEGVGAEQQDIGEFNASFLKLFEEDADGYLPEVDAPGLDAAGVVEGDGDLGALADELVNRVMGDGVGDGLPDGDL